MFVIDLLHFFLGTVSSKVILPAAYATAWYNRYTGRWKSGRVQNKISCWEEWTQWRMAGFLAFTWLGGRRCFSFSVIQILQIEGQNSEIVLLSSLVIWYMLLCVSCMVCEWKKEFSELWVTEWDPKHECFSKLFLRYDFVTNFCT